MLKWVEISQYPAPERLSVLEKYLNSKGIENKVEYVQATKENFLEKLKPLFSSFDSIRVGRGLGDAAPSHFNNNSVFIQKIATADCILKIHGQWQLRSSIYESLVEITSRVGARFDLESHVLLVGTGAVARASVAALARAGFSRFGVSDQSTERVQAFCAEMKKVFLGATWTPIPKDELILLPGQYGVLVNTTPLEEGNDILDELSYFNFFRKNAVAFDFTVQPIETPLLTEAKDVGVHPVYGFEIAGLADEIWVKWVLGENIDMSGYSALLEAELRQK